MRPRIATLLVLAALTAVSALAPPEAPASCAAGVRFHDAFYTHAATRSTVATGSRLHGGLVPGCNDTVVLGPDGRRLDAAEPDRPAKLRRLRGIPARLAVAQHGTPGVFVAPGTFPALRDHPLHGALHGSRSVPDARRGRRCGPAHVVTGTVPSTPLAGGRLTVRTAAGTSVSLTVDAATRFRRGRRVAGQPVVARGDTLRIVGQRCDDGAERPLVVLRARVRAGS